MNLQVKFKIGSSEMIFNGTWEDWQALYSQIPLKVKIHSLTMQCTRTDALSLIQERKNQIQACKFVKRTDGTIREMNFRLGVKKYLKGGDAAYSFEEKKLIPVYDMQAKGYRSIPIEGITEIALHGNWVKIIQ